MKQTQVDECTKAIDSFLDGSCGDWDWDDFTSITSKDPVIQSIKGYCADSSFLYPSESPKTWCNNVGTEKLSQLSALIKKGVDSDILNFIENEIKNAEPAN